MQLRQYQSDAADATSGSFETGGRAALIVMPTGTGKTVVFCEVARRMQEEGRVMVIAHRRELIDQAARKVWQVTGSEPAVEMADDWSEQGFTSGSWAVVSSIQTQISGMRGRGRMTQFPPSDFALLVIDEAHHSPAKSYRRVIEYYRQHQGLRLLGVTATPDRADEAALGQIFDEVVYDYELPDAINEGWLVPIRQQMIRVDGLDLSGIRTQAGDLNQAELAATMELERNLHSVASPTLEIAGNRKTLIFCTRVHQAERMAEILNRSVAGSAAMVHGGTPHEERRQVFRGFEDGDYQYLCNVGVTTEGYDCPGIEVVVMARPTMSRSLYAQMVGRGTRALPGLLDDMNSAEDSERRSVILSSRKPHLTVLDFVGNCGRHKLVSCADILGGNYTDVEISRARTMCEASDGDVVRCLEDARRQLKNEAEEAARKRRRSLVVKASYRSREVDPFDILDVSRGRPRGWDRDAPPTEKQMVTLAKFGLGDERHELNRKEATLLLNQLFSNIRGGRASYKQTRLLKRFGLDGKYGFEEASGLIDAIASNGWKVPNHLLERSDVE